MEDIIKIVFYFFTVSILSLFLSKYIYKVYKGDKTILSKIITPLEKKLYHMLSIKQEEMSAKKYIQAILFFMLFSFILLFTLLLSQNIFQNQEGKMSISLAFHTAISFVTNTNQQNYSAESLASWVQMLGITVQNFLSAGVGISVLFALIRGLQAKSIKTIGNFWKDLIRTILYILLPLSIFTSVLLVSTGVVQTLQTQKSLTTLEGETQEIILGPVASQVAIKQLGSNGGGYYSTNSANPLENPNGYSNFIEMVGILLLPVSLVLFLARVLNNKKQGYMILKVMTILLLLVTIGIIRSRK